MDKLVRTRMYKKEYDLLMKFAKKNYLRTGNKLSLAKALRKMLLGNKE